MNRNDRIVELRRQKKTYQEIGDEFGISRERVRQILGRINPELCGPIFRQKSKTIKAILRECGLRKCFLCRGIFPNTTEYYHRQSNGTSLTSHCKRCNTVRHREYREKNREHDRQYGREYREKNKERIDGYLARWQKANPEKVAQYQKKKRANRKSLPKWKICDSLRAGVRLSLESGKSGHSWESLVGYTLEQLVTHLESQFTKGMTWENYGYYGWHIDHIRPISDFNFESPGDPEFLQCWSLWNLQPLWAFDNLSKNNKCENPPLPLIQCEEKF